MTTVVLASGGLDSTVLAFDLARHDDLVLLSVNYGQRHVRELDAAADVATSLNARHLILDLAPLGRLLSSSLTDEARAVPHGHYAAPTMVATIVPNRNAVMLSAAVGIAVSHGAEVVATAVHAGDHPVYPDCRPEFIDAMDATMRLALAGVADVRVVAPYVSMTKADVVRHGAGLAVPFARTWSCYEGGRLHCGECGTCYERREAFVLAGLADATEYAT